MREGELPGFIPEYGDEFQAWDYLNHLFAIPEPAEERGYVSFIPLSVGGYTIKRKWFDEDATRRGEKYQPAPAGIADLAEHVRVTMGLPAAEQLPPDQLQCDRPAWSPDGEQFGFSVADGRLQGHVDGVIVGGPEGFTYPALWECKCLGNKSWSDLEKKGLAISKPIYAAQVAIYQAYLELHEHPAIFTALNADTMEIYTELVPFDAALAQRMSDRAVKVITATEAGEILPRAFHDSTHFECRMCAWQDRCWRTQA